MDGVIPTESMLKQFVSRKLGTLCGYKICFLNPVTFKESAVPSVCFPQGELLSVVFGQSIFRSKNQRGIFKVSVSGIYKLESPGQF